MILPTGPNTPTQTAPHWVIGLDIGQRRDYSALAIIEAVETLTGQRNPVTYELIRTPNIRLRHVERIHLGTPFAAVVDRVSAIAHDPRFHQAALVVDATGVGAPVVELIRAARLPCRLIPVQITGGIDESCDGTYHRVPKRDLVTGLQVLLDRWPLDISTKAPSVAALITELVEFKARPSSSGGISFNGTKHDDLTMALALAWWWMRKRANWCLPELMGDGVRRAA